MKRLIKRTTSIQRVDWKEWIMARDGEFARLSDMQSMWCCCGKLATGLHEQRCKQFQNMVDLATIEKLKHLIPEKIMKSSQKCSDCEFRSDSGVCELYNVAEPLTGECYNW